MLTIAYIGNGKSTNRYHIPFVQKIKDIKIKKIYSRRPSKNDPWKAIDGVDYVTDLNELWDDPEIQVVVICTPPQAHYDLAMAALQHHKNIVLEKPFTETAAQAKKIFDFAKKEGLFVEAYQNRRFDSEFLTAQKVIESGKLGDILEVEMAFDYFRPQASENSHGYSRLDSFLYGHACHSVDQVLSYWGNPESIHYDVRNLLGQNHMNDYFDLDFYYANNLKVSVKSSFFHLIYRPAMVVYGKKGRFIKPLVDRQEEHLKMFYMPTHADFGVDSPDRYGTLSYIDDSGQFREEKVATVTGDYSRYYQALYDSLINGKEKLVKDEQTIKLVEILEKGAQSLEKNFQKTSV